jgi:RimJ/RimL family protein N-acetyltransferase
MRILAAPAAGRTEIANFSATETLRDGRMIEIRAWRPSDRSGLMAAVGRISDEALRRRFFTIKRHFSDKEVAHFTEVDFVKQVALVAIAHERGEPAIVGGGRYFVVRPDTAEVAFALVDDYQGRGIGTALMRHLIAIARHAGLQTLVANLLPDNEPMFGVLRKCRLPLETRRDRDAVHVTLEL